MASQAALTIVLAALAPLTVFWYASSTHYRGGHPVQRRHVRRRQPRRRRWCWPAAYRPLIARNPKHRWLLRTWIVIYAFVGIQMGWTLRPSSAPPDEPVRFFRGGELENAYVVVARMVWETLIP